jgi:hypothetical protein
LPASARASGPVSRVIAGRSCAVRAFLATAGDAFETAPSFAAGRRYTSIQVGARRAISALCASIHGATGEKSLFRSRVGAGSIFITIAGLGAGCNQEALRSDELGEIQEAMCAGGDGVHAVMAALAVATAMELGRWQSVSDFDVAGGELALTDSARSRCEDGACWNTQAILDLQRAGADIEFEHAQFHGDVFRRRLVRQHAEQQRCDARAGRGHSDCEAETHALSFSSSDADACTTVFTFEATTPEGGALENPGSLAKALVFVGYPENPYLAFASTDRSVSVDPTYGLNEDPSTSAGSCSSTCVKMSSSDASGQCCMCGGAAGTYARSTFSASVYLCQQ